MSRIKAVLIDLNGTLHIGNNVLGNAIKSLQQLKNAGIKCCFLTNNSKMSTNELLLKINKLGFNVSSNELISASGAAINTIKKNSLNPYLLISQNTASEFEPFYSNQQNIIKKINLNPTSELELLSEFDSVFVGMRFC